MTLAGSVGTILPRPVLFSDANRRDAAANLAPLAIEWAYGTLATVQHVAQDLGDAMVAVSPSLDGFAIVAALNARDWRRDEDLVALLKTSNLMDLMFQAHLDAERRWVIENGVVLHFGVGTLVAVTGGEGEIVGLCHRSAKYLVEVIDGRGILIRSRYAAESCRAIEMAVAV